MSEEEHDYGLIIRNVLSTIALIGAIGGVFIWTFTQWSKWSNIPEQVTELTIQIASLTEAISRNTNTDFFIVDILGGHIKVLNPEIQAGEDIYIAFYSRAKVDCERRILVRFFHHESRTFFRGQRLDPAVRSPVSEDYALLVIPIKTFDDMPEGTYSYAPEVVPGNCGPYERQTLPMSTPFKVTK